MPAKKPFTSTISGGNLPGAMQMPVNPTPLLRARLTPRTGKFAKLHSLLDSVATNGSNIEEVLTEAWHYADHNNPDELAFVVALAQMFAKFRPGEPLPVAAE